MLEQTADTEYLRFDGLITISIQSAEANESILSLSYELMTL